MHTTRNVIVVVGALAIWMVAMAAIFLAGAEALNEFVFADSSVGSSLFRQYAIRLVIHAGLGLVVGFLIGLGVISARPVRWALAAATVMVALALVVTLDLWFSAIQIQYQVVEVATAVLPSVACVGGCLIASKLVRRARVQNAL